MNTLFVLLPCYNEEKDLLLLLDKWKKQAELINKEFGYDVQIVGINDGSKDSTLEILNKYCESYANMKVLDHGNNRGLGKALETGLKYFKDEAKKGDFAVVMDSDNTHNPSFIMGMFEKQKQENSGCVIASRYCQESKITGVPFYRNFMSFGARFLYCILLNVPNVKDYTCGYRLYSLESVNKLFELYGEKAVTQSGFSCMVEVLYKMHLAGVKFNEAPFVLEYGLKQGESKMRVLKTIKNSLSITFYLKRHGRDDLNDKKNNKI